MHGAHNSVSLRYQRTHSDSLLHMEACRSLELPCNVLSRELVTVHLCIHACVNSGNESYLPQVCISHTLGTVHSN